MGEEGWVTKNERGGKAAWDEFHLYFPKSKQASVRAQTILTQSVVKSYNASKTEFVEASRENVDDPLGLIDITAGFLDKYYKCYDSRFLASGLEKLKEKAGATHPLVDEFCMIIDPKVKTNYYTNLHCRTYGESP